MRHTLTPLFVCLIALGGTRAQAQEEKISKREQVEFPAADGLKITADLYPGPAKEAPILLLCHQAKASRGEYRKIAPRLQRQGFNCLAIDQRSGKRWKKVTNETAKRARKAKKGSDFLDARQDIEAAISWIKTEGYTGKLVLWGSSYSASLVLVIAANRDDIQAVLAFSPGEHFKPRLSVAEAVTTLEFTPVFLAAPETERKEVMAIHASLSPTCMAQFTLDDRILHGSRTLTEGAFARELWEQGVTPFLQQYAVQFNKPGK